MEKHNEIAKMLLEIKAVDIRNPQDLFTWVSGIKAPIYCDNRIIMSYPDVRDYVAEGFKEIIEKEFKDLEVIAGTATAGIPHGAWLAHKLNLPMVYVRNSSKGHGKQNLIEGRLLKGQRVVVIEDLLSTGGSSFKAVKALEEAGAHVLGVLGIFSYDFKSLKDLFTQENIKYRTLTNYEVLLSVALDMKYIKKEELDILMEWSKNPYIFTEKKE